MAIYSHSRLTTFETCPLQYRYRYVDKIKRDVEGIEQFLGICVHKTMEKLYRDLNMTRLNSLEDLIVFFNDFWKKNWHQNIKNIKGKYTFEDYRKVGERCIRDYYKRYLPFNQSRTLALEEPVAIILDGQGRYKMTGFIDRLAQADGGTYEIHDYKTSAFLPTQDLVDQDRQLPLYQIAIQDRWPDAERIKLIWHFMLFDKEMSSWRTSEDLEDLKVQTIELINQIEDIKEFPPRESQLCDWCDYPDLCPIQKHRYKVDTLSVNEYLNEEGVVLVEKFMELKRQKESLIESLEQEIAKVKEAVIQYAQREGVEIIKGINNRLRIKLKEDIRFPNKGDLLREELDRIVRDSGKWMEVSDLNLAALANILKARKWDSKLLDAIERYQRLEKTYYLYPSRIMDDERLYETRDL